MSDENAPTDESRPELPEDGPGPVPLALAFLWSELRGQGWKLFAFPVAIGALIAGSVIGASVTSLSLDPQTTELLQESAEQYFTTPPAADDLLVALIVVQGPSIVMALAAVISLFTVQTGLGRRLAGGEFELLLSGPYRDKDVFAALVLGAFLIVLLGVAVLAVLSMGVGLAILLTAGVELSSSGVALFSVGTVALIPMVLWATFVSVVVYLVFPEAATNNTHPGNLLAAAAILPAIGIVVASTTDLGIDPLVIVVGANVVPLIGITIGWVTVRQWFSVEKVL